jgi:hypothetical protein
MTIPNQKLKLWYKEDIVKDVSCAEHKTERERKIKL